MTALSVTELTEATWKLRSLDDPMRWRKPRMVTAVDTGRYGNDLFHYSVPDHVIVEVFARMWWAPRHTFQIHTKHAKRMQMFLPLIQEDLRRREYDLALVDAPTPLTWPLPNVWLGVDVGGQQDADRFVPLLLATPAAVRWVFCNPPLGPVDLDQPRCEHHDRDEITTDDTGQEWCGDCVADGSTGELSFGHWLDPLNGGIDWVVVSGESGHRSRPMHPDWVRGLRDQCVSAGVPFRFTQWGDHIAVPVFDAPRMSGGRAIHAPGGGTQSASITEPGPSGTFRNSTTRLMVPGDRTKGGMVMLDVDTIAYPVGRAAAGRDLDGQTWDQYPTVGEGDV